MRTKQFKHATTAQLKNCFEDADINLTLRNDLSYYLPMGFTFPNQLSRSFYQRWTPREPERFRRVRYIGAGYCHWSVRGNLLTAEKLWPAESWLILSGVNHSTVIGAESHYIFDPFMQAIGETAQETYQYAKSESREFDFNNYDFCFGDDYGKLSESLVDFEYCRAVRTRFDRRFRGE